MDYKVVATAEAEEDLNQFIQYLLFAKKNKQVGVAVSLEYFVHSHLLLQHPFFVKFLFLQVQMYIVLFCYFPY